jgi:hypothetical protein
MFICYVEESRPLLWSGGQSSGLQNGDALCFLWGTNWIYICYVEESRPPLWSSGQSSWLKNVDVLCFLWGTNWIFICYVEESTPPTESVSVTQWVSHEASLDVGEGKKISLPCYPSYPPACHMFSNMLVWIWCQSMVQRIVAQPWGLKIPSWTLDVLIDLLQSSAYCAVSSECWRFAFIMEHRTVPLYISWESASCGRIVWHTEIKRQLAR